MGSRGCAGEMCLEGGGGRAPGRRGGKKASAAEQKVAKQPQRGLGVAQLEKIRMQNQMIAAYRSGMPPPQQQQHLPFAGAIAGTGTPSNFQPYLTDCFEAMDRRIADVQQYSQYYAAENMLPYSHSHSRQPATPLFVHDAKVDSSSSAPQRQHQHQQPPQYYWMISGHDSSGRSGAGISSEELDLELRL